MPQIEWGEWVGVSYDLMIFQQAHKEGTKKILSIDAEYKSAIMRGKKWGTYYVTLDFCDCNDFMITRKEESPCFHVYKLALVLGEIQDARLAELLQEAAHETGVNMIRSGTQLVLDKCPQYKQELFEVLKGLIDGTTE